MQITRRALLIYHPMWSVKPHMIAAENQLLKIPLRSLNRSSGCGAPGFCGCAMGDNAEATGTADAAGVVAGSEVSEPELPHRA